MTHNDTIGGSIALLQYIAEDLRAMSSAESPGQIELAAYSAALNKVASTLMVDALPFNRLEGPHA